MNLLHSFHRYSEKYALGNLESTTAVIDNIPRVDVVLWYLVILVGGDREELGLGEDEGALSSAPPQHVPRFDEVNSGLVAMQGVQDDLRSKEETLTPNAPQRRARCVAVFRPVCGVLHVPGSPACCW